MFDLFQEIISTIRRNKMRTFLTGFAVAWGIFMLIVLLGSGNGLKNGFDSNFGDRMVNVVNVYGGRTSIPYAGFARGRAIVLGNDDLFYTKNDFPEEVDDVMGAIRVGTKEIGRKTEYITASIRGVHPQWLKMEGLYLLNGRFINELDIKGERKSVVISKKANSVLFENEEAIGSNVIIDGFVYTVVGIYYNKDREDVLDAFIPVSTARIIYGKGDSFSLLAFVLNKKIDSEELNTEFMNRYKRRVAQHHQFSPEDNALWYWNRFESYLEMKSGQKYIDLAVWIIGIFTLLSGVVGVSNIMLITVRERTKEIGIRKAIGASPFSVLRLIVVESIVITTVFGYIGLLCGIGLTELVNSIVSASASGGEESLSMFVNPTVDISVAIESTIVLIVAGCIAGFFPALQAVKIKTIEALNSK